MSASDATPGRRSARSLALFQGIVILVALLIVWLAWDFVREDEKSRGKAARRQVGVTADLAVSEIRSALSGAADSLQILSRLPELRDMRRYGPAVAQAGSLNSTFLSFAADLAFFQPAATVIILDGWKTAGSEWDLLLARVRRTFYDAGLLAFFEALSMPDSDSWPFALPSFPAQTPGWADIPAFFASAMEQPLIGTGRFLDLAFGWGITVPADSQESGRLLTATLSDRDLIRSIAVRGLDGREVAAVSEIGGALSLGGGWWRRGLRQNRPFYAGPTLFDESMGRPLWQAGVPLRNITREPAGLLTAQIDLGFLSDLAGRACLTPGTTLIITDEDGVIIGHQKTALVVSQVNVRHSNPAVAAAIEGDEGESEIRLAGVSYVAAWRSVRGGDRYRLPGWALICLVPASELASGWFRTVLLSVLLASLTLCALFYVSGLIESAFDEDAEV